MSSVSQARRLRLPRSQAQRAGFQPHTSLTCLRAPLPTETTPGCNCGSGRRSREILRSSPGRLVRVLEKAQQRDS